jgi:multidrug efflux pump
MQIINAAVSRSRTTILFLIVILVAGMTTYINTPKEAEPDIEIPNIYISITHEGISPEDSERLLIRPIEQEVRSIAGIKQIDADAYEGGANIQLEFYAGTNTNAALQETRAKVDLARVKLPKETEEISVNEVKFSRFDPMMVINIAGEVPERTLSYLAKDLKDKIEANKGVLEAVLVGDREEVMEIIIDPLAMESYGLDPFDILNLVNANNRLVSAGAMQNTKGRSPVKISGVFESAKDVLEMPIKVDGNRIVHFGDVASVQRTYKDAQAIARLNGEPALAIEVIQRSGANIISTVDEIKELIKTEQQYWPANINIVVSRDKSKEVKTMLSDLQNSVISAVVLVFIIIIGILGLRSAILVGIAVPGSFLLGILLISMLGITINMMVLFALIMAVGMLVDGAIVVTELADRRMSEGDSKKEAYSAAARRMSWPIIASTCTTLTAFIPLAFWPDMIGEFMKFLPITLIAVLSSSLVMALIFIPTLGSLIGKAGSVDQKMLHNLSAAEKGDINSVTGFTGKYIKFLRKALQRPTINIFMVSILLVVIYVAFFFFGRGVELFPETEPEFANIEIYARGDLSITEKDTLVKQIESFVIDSSETESIYVKVGSSGSGEGRSGENSASQDLIGTISLNLKEWDQRRPVDEIITEIRESLTGIVGIKLATEKPESGPPSGKPISIEISSRNPELLNESVEKISNALGSLDGLLIYKMTDHYQE